jgi:Cys-tRNA(Pro) deacylase
MIDPNLTGRPRVEAALEILGIEAAIVSPGTPMPTVPLAAEAVGCTVDQIIKTVVFVTKDRHPVVAVANGTNRIDRQRLAAAVGVSTLKLADPEFVLDVTGYPAGGVSPVGIRTQDAPIIIDGAVLEQDSVYGGAGTEHDLLHVATRDLVAVTGGRVCAITRGD